MLKVVTNMISAVTMQTLAEALAIVQKAGLDPECSPPRSNTTPAAPASMDLKLPKMIAGDYEPHFSLKHMFKDVQLGIHMANALDIEIPATTVTAGVMYGALNHGWGDLDYAALFKIYDGAFPHRASSNAGRRSDGRRSESSTYRTVPGVPPRIFRRTATDTSTETRNGESKPMEVVADVPKDAKPAGEAASRCRRKPRRTSRAPWSTKRVARRQARRRTAVQSASAAFFFSPAPK